MPLLLYIKMKFSQIHSTGWSNEPGNTIVLSNNQTQVIHYICRWEIDFSTAGLSEVLFKFQTYYLSFWKKPLTVMELHSARVPFHPWWPCTVNIHPNMFVFFLQTGDETSSTWTQRHFCSALIKWTNHGSWRLINSFWSWLHYHTVYSKYNEAGAALGESQWR